MRSWTITIIDTGAEIRATIRNDQTANTIEMPAQEYDPSESWERDDAVAEIMNGHLPNVRDSFDTV